MFNKIFKKLLSAPVLAVFVFSIFASPVLVFAQPQADPTRTSNETIGIPCEGVKLVGGKWVADCGFDDLMKLASNIMTFLILLSIPIATIAFAWSGWLILSAGGNSGQVDKAKEIFTKVLIGFFFVLAAWLIVKLVTGAFLQSGYIDLV